MALRHGTVAAVTGDPPTRAPSELPVGGSSARRTAALLWTGIFVVYLSAVPAPTPMSVSIDVRSNEVTSSALGTTPALPSQLVFGPSERVGSPTSWHVPCQTL